MISHENEYTTQYDNQTEMNLLIYQCDEDIDFINEKNNDGKEKAVCIGEFKLTNIPSKPKGKEKINVKFEVNEQNVVNVVATCTSNGAQNNVVIEVNRI